MTNFELFMLQSSTTLGDEYSTHVSSTIGLKTMDGDEPKNSEADAVVFKPKAYLYLQFCTMRHKGETSKSQSIF